MPKFKADVSKSFTAVGKIESGPHVENIEFARNIGSPSPLMSIPILRKRGLQCALRIDVLNYLKNLKKKILLILM
jgi:hypothetical protein